MTPQSILEGIIKKEILPKLTTRSKCEIVAKLLAIGSDWEYENHAFNPLLSEEVEKVWKTIRKRPLYWSRTILMELERTCERERAI